MRLNGWQRLWVVLSTLYLVIVLTDLYVQWPTPNRTTHRDEFIARMPEDARKHVVAAYSSEYAAREDRSGYIHFTMPNGAVLVLRGRIDPRLVAVRAKYHEYDDLSDVQLATALRTKRRSEFGDLAPPTFVADEDSARVANAYDEIFSDAARGDRWRVIVDGFLLWLIPCLVLYALGWSVAWIRRGFRAPAAS